MTFKKRRAAVRGQRLFLLPDVENTRFKLRSVAAASTAVVIVVSASASAAVVVVAAANVKQKDENKDPAAAVSAKIEA